MPVQCLLYGCSLLVSSYDLSSIEIELSQVIQYGEVNENGAVYERHI